MKKVYMVEEDTEIQRVLDDTYSEMFAALKYRNPKAESIVDDDEISKLHDILALMRSGHVKLNYHDLNGVRHMILEVSEH